VELFRTEQLTVKDLLKHAGGRPAAAPGGLVVLAACRSDLADRDHDEALTLATAFLACGSASVVGTRWEVDDRTSAVLMCLFHRYLTVDRMPPAHALRAAQLWTLDPARVLPPDIVAAAGVGDRLEIPLTTWAAYTHQGR
jgi:CHAT domain-containing protein